MKNYHRYCAFCFQAGDDEFRCSNHPKGLEPHWTREQINRPTECPNFALSDLGDAETGRMYRPIIRHAQNANTEQIHAEQIQMNFDC